MNKNTEHNKKLIELDNNSTLERTDVEQEELLALKNEALIYLKNFLGKDFDLHNKYFLSPNPSLLKIGLLLKDLSLEKSPENELNLFNEMHELLKPIGLDKNLKLSKDQDKEMDIEAILIKEAKTHNHLKETIMPDARENHNGQIPKSLVINLPTDKISSIYKKFYPNLDERLLNDKINSFIEKQTHGIEIDRETFHDYNSLIEPSSVKMNIARMRERSLDLNIETPNKIIGSFGLITETRKLRA